MVKKETDLVTPLLKTFPELLHGLRQYFSAWAAHWKYLGKFQKCSVLTPTQTNETRTDGVEFWLCFRVFGKLLSDSQMESRLRTTALRD